MGGKDRGTEVLAVRIRQNRDDHHCVAAPALTILTPLRQEALAMSNENESTTSRELTAEELEQVSGGRVKVVLSGGHNSNVG
jgi:bacteriocin-like protein